MFLDKIAEFGIPVVDSHDPVSNPSAFVAQIRKIEGSEGVIVAWPDGHRVKLKGDWYITRHRAKDQILRENGVIELVLNEKIDDVKPILPDDNRRRLEEFEADLWHGIRDTSAQWALAFYDVKRKFGDDRKAFAIEWAPGFESNLRSAIFRAWDSEEFDWQAAVVDAVKKNLGSQTKVNEARFLWGNAKWDYGATTGDE